MTIASENPMSRDAQRCQKQQCRDHLADPGLQRQSEVGPDDPGQKARHQREAAMPLGE